MAIDETMLMAYADGELVGDEKAAVEAAIAADPALAETVARHRSLRGALAGAFDPVLAEPLPAGLAALAVQPAAIDLAEARRRRQSGQPSFAVRWGAIAAALAIGVVAGQMLGGSGGLVRMTDGALVARGDLAAALDRQLAADDPSSGNSPVRIGLTFRTGEGTYCRSFSAARADALSGIACHDGGAWTLRMAVAARPETPGGYRMAGGDARILDTVQAMIDGAPFDAAAESKARDRGWKP